MKRYLLKIIYDGTNFAGWQRQKNQCSIQETIENALKIFFKEKTSITGSGRTDANAHAFEQYAHFTTEKEVDKKIILNALNGMIEKEIRILDIFEVDENFHARFSVKSKIYQYHICLKNFQNPFKRGYSYHFSRKIDLDLLNRAKKEFIGKHDFTSFANKGSSSKNFEKTIKRIDITKTEDGIIIEIEADGFLYKMVRNIVGTLLKTAHGKLEISDINKILLSKDRRKAPMAVPAYGLFLKKVIY